LSTKLSHVFLGARFKANDRPYVPGGRLKFDFDTWLVQNYGLKADGLDKKALALAKREYIEEYPPVGESAIKLKTYPFKKYLDSKRK
jgi:hypothetical protein